MPNYDLITILGPTASGKTPFAAALAYELNTEIISADSRQIYRGMDLGTGKDLADYTVNGHKIPYHLIDIAAPGYCLLYTSDAAYESRGSYICGGLAAKEKQKAHYANTHYLSK